MRLRFLWAGRTRSAPIDALVEDYLGRIRHMVPCEVIETRDLARTRSLKAGALVRAEAGEFARHLVPAGTLVALDENGRQFSSAAFSRWLESAMQRGGRSITFVIGGAEGLSPEISRKADLVLSMGAMTWTHEMSRVLVAEQVYRALCIQRGIPYHKA